MLAIDAALQSFADNYPTRSRVPARLRSGRTSVRSQRSRQSWQWPSRRSRWIPHANGTLSAPFSRHRASKGPPEYCQDDTVTHLNYDGLLLTLVHYNRNSDRTLEAPNACSDAAMFARAPGASTCGAAAWTVSFSAMIACTCCLFLVCYFLCFLK